MDQHNEMWAPSGDGIKRYAMTCDVEDYFHVSAFEDHIDREDWKSLECRIPRNIDRILELFSNSNAKGTFFILGWVANTFPRVVQQIADAGHEIASHGMEHVRVWRQERSEFFLDAEQSRKMLEDVSGVPVVGYRAASWSIDTRSDWAHDVLAEAGYEYSSSTYPISHDHFGEPDAPAAPFYVRGNGLLEIPASTVRVLGRNVAAGGGGFFRLYPFSVSRWMIQQVERANRPYMFYFHPWELDADQPRISGVSLRARFRHYLNLDRFGPRLSRLLSEYRWERMDEVFLRDGR